MKKVKIIKNAGSYKKDEIKELTDEQALLFVNIGIAEYAGKTTKTKTKVVKSKDTIKKNVNDSDSDK